jgi:hypothetical protein
LESSAETQRKQKPAKTTGKWLDGLAAKTRQLRSGEYGPEALGQDAAARELLYPAPGVAIMKAGMAGARVPSAARLFCLPHVLR